jgi:SAM-dependent methyltransferase
VSSYLRRTRLLFSLPSHLLSSAGLPAHPPLARLRRAVSPKDVLTRAARVARIRGRHPLDSTRSDVLGILLGMARYDSIGRGYAATRREDPRFAARIVAALGGAKSIVNVGAGTGLYEPSDRYVLAIEPSDVMAAQRGPHLAPAVRGEAHCLPLRDGSVDAAMTVLSLHHWDDHQEQGVREFRRVARGPVVIVTYEPAVCEEMWLVKDYLPEVAALDRLIAPSTAQLATWLGGRTRIDTIAVPRDTPDWTLMSFWAHPERVLDAAARNATSGFARLPVVVVERVVTAVQRDLQDGKWDRRHGYLRQMNEYDAGLRLVVNLPA